MRIDSTSIQTALIVLLFVQFSTQQTCTAGYECGTVCNDYNATDVVLPCGVGFFCVGNDIGLCPRGYYCPSPSEKYICKEGTFCPKGSWQPLDCPSLASCDTKSYRYTFWGFFLYLPVVLIYVTVLSMAYRYKDYLLNKVGITNRKVEPPAEKVTATANQKLDISFENLEVKLSPGNFITRRWKDEKIILSGASGELKSGRLVGIMGPSGAGKTTLMNVLLGKIKKTSGSIFINGKKRSIKKFQKVIGFVPQEDVMINSLSVQTILTHSASTRLPDAWTQQEKRGFVWEIMDVLGLSHVANSIIGDTLHRGVSGGERKRVNIGIELVTLPKALFLDEPTSGLDSSSAKDVMLYLRDISKKLGITSVAVLHQPRYDLFLLCDDIILLGKGGKTVYSGPSDKTLEYFESIGFKCPEFANPADFYLDVIAGEVPRANDPTFQPADLFEFWNNYRKSNNQLKSSSNYQTSADYSSSNPLKNTQENKLAKSTTGTDDIPKRTTPNFFLQLAMYLKRASTQHLTNFRTRASDVILHAMAGIVIGIGFFSDDLFIPPIPRQYYDWCPVSVRDIFCNIAQQDNITRLGVYLCMAVGTVAVTIAVRTFYNERVVYWREASSGGNTVAYFIAKCLVDLEAMLINTLVLVSALFIVTSPAGHFGNYFLGVFLFEYCSYGAAYVISWLLPYPSLFSVIVALLCGLGTGATSSISDMGPIGYISWARWWGEYFYIIELRENTYHDTVKPLIRGYVDDAAGYDLDNKTGALIGMVVVGTCLRILAYIVMRLMNKDKQR